MKILLATDGSEHSEDAARFLTRFNFSSKDDIIVLHVVSEIPYADDIRAQIRHAIKRVAPKILRAATDILKPVKAKVHTLEEEGYPDTTIVDVATTNNVDLIVMGARGLKGIKSFLLGSSTRAVAISSPKPVLITKPAHKKVSKKMTVLFASDGSPSSDATARTLSLLPFPEDSEITVMNVAWSPATDIPERYVMEIADKVKAAVAQAREIEFEKSAIIIKKAKSLLGDRFTEIRELSRGGDPSLEILNEAKALKADIIALGSRGLRGVKGMLGSVSRRVLGHSECPVLIGKAE